MATPNIIVIITSYIDNVALAFFLEVTRGQVVRAGVSVTWNVLSCLDVMSSNPGQVNLVCIVLLS